MKTFNAEKYIYFAGVISPVANEEVKRKHKIAIAEYFHYNKKRNSIYGAKFVICEFLNIFNSSLQVYLIDKLLGGEFTTYGLKGKRKTIF